MLTKFCNTCQILKSIKEFSKNNSKSDGLQSMCKPCKKEYGKNHYLLNKEVRGIESHIKLKEWYKKIKIFKNCEKCGETHIACLEFHHIDSTKKEFSISMAVSWGWSKNKILKEMDKCIVLCSNCHRKLHYDLNN